MVLKCLLADSLTDPLVDMCRVQNCERGRAETERQQRTTKMYAGVRCAEMHAEQRDPFTGDHRTEGLVASNHSAESKKTIVKVEKTKEFKQRQRSMLSKHFGLGDAAGVVARQRGMCEYDSGTAASAACCVQGRSDHEEPHGVLRRTEPS